MEKPLWLRHWLFNRELALMGAEDYVCNLGLLKLRVEEDPVAGRALVRRGLKLAESFKPNIGLEVFRELADVASESQDGRLVVKVFNEAAALVPSCNRGSQTSYLFEKFLVVRLFNDSAVVVPSCNGGPQTSYLLENLLVSVAGQAGGAAESLITDRFMISARGGSEKRRTVVVFGATPETTHVLTGCFKGNLPALEEAVWRKHSPGSPERVHYDTVLKAAFDVVHGRISPPDIIEELRTGGPNPVARGVIKWQTLAR